MDLHVAAGAVIVLTTRFGLLITMHLTLVVLATSAAARELPSSQEAEQLHTPELYVEPAGIAFEVQPGDTMPTRTLTIANHGGQVMSWSVDVPPNLRVTPASGELNHGESIKVSVSPLASALPSADAEFDLKINAPGAQGSPATVRVDFIIVPLTPEIRVTGPAAGAEWEADSVQETTWDTVGAVTGPLLVHLSTDGGNTWKVLGRVPVTSKGARIRTPSLASKQCQLRVQDATGEVTGVSGFFTIASEPPAPPETAEISNTESTARPGHGLGLPADNAPSAALAYTSARRLGVGVGTMVTMGAAQEKVGAGPALDLRLHFPTASGHLWSINGRVSQASVQPDADDSNRRYDTLMLSLGGEFRWVMNSEGRVSPYGLVGASFLLERPDPGFYDDADYNGAGAADLGAGVQFGRFDFRAAYSALLGSENASGLTFITLGYRF